MAISSYPITGIKVGGVAARKEVNAWAIDPSNRVQFSLFIQAMIKFQAMTFQDQLSYFRVAGIHGLPATPWDHDPDPTTANKTYQDGRYAPTENTANLYCPHNSLIFPTWHRAYMLLFEQRLWEIMAKEIVPGIPNAAAKAEWLAAANTWRMPYWDWAAHPEVPSIVATEKVSIVQPDGSETTVSNPLYKFTTANIKELGGKTVPLDSDVFGQWAIKKDVPYSQTAATSRWGLPSGTLTPAQIAGVENNSEVNQELQKPDFQAAGEPSLSGSIQDQVTRLFLPSSFQNFAEFATTRHGSPSNPAGWLSIETIHNCIHEFVGGVDNNAQGHMADLGTAAFDPIFWLHHCNVDRQLAMYQASNGKGHWWDGAFPTTDPKPNDPLFPFHTDAVRTHFTSDMLRDWTQWGYTYDTLQKPGSDGLDASPADLRQHITEKYGVLRRALRNVDQGMKGLDKDYIINVVYNRYGLEGRSYIIHFFVGDEAAIPSEPSQFTRSPNHAGSIHTFSTSYWTRGNTNEVSCENCTKQQDDHVLSNGQVPVTLQLLGRAASSEECWSGINHLGRDHIEEYLEKNLHWRIVAVPGQLIDVEQLPDLKVIVLAGKAEHPDDPSQLSNFSEYQPIWRATRGKVGGATAEDGLVQ